METNRNAKTLNALGLCARARKLIFGSPMICEALRAKKNKPLLVLCANDSSENTAKRLRDRCAFYEVRMETLECNGEALAKAVGKTGKLSAVAVSDENLCRLVSGTLEEKTIL